MKTLATLMACGALLCGCANNPASYGAGQSYNSDVSRYYDGQQYRDDSRTTYEKGLIYQDRDPQRYPDHCCEP